MEIRIPKTSSDKIISLLMAISRDFPEYTNDLLQLIRSVKEGIQIEILPLVFGHTRQQMKYYRKWCAEFGNDVGLPPDKMHDIVLCECYGSKMVNTPFGWQQVPLKRSGDTDRGEFGDLIETLIRLAAENNFVIPPPMRKNHERNEEAA